MPSISRVNVLQGYGGSFGLSTSQMLKSCGSNSVRRRQPNTHMKQGNPAGCKYRWQLTFWYSSIARPVAGGHGLPQVSSVLFCRPYSISQKQVQGDNGVISSVLQCLARLKFFVPKFLHTKSSGSQPMQIIFPINTPVVSFPFRFQ